MKLKFHETQIIFLLFSVMQTDDYYVAGVVIALSLVCEGPAPRMLSDELYSAILVEDPEKVAVSLDSLPESTMKTDLECVINCIFII
jgi:hypothetical protein